MGGLVETVLPARMGTPFRWLVASSWVSNLGDGVAIAAGPLLVASLTRDPLVVALAALLQQLPWLLLGLHAGVLADRVDRRALVVAVDLARAGVLAVLVLALATGDVGIPAVLAALFVLGAAEVFADTAAGTLLPMVVPRADLGIGNARLTAGTLTMNQLAGPAVGGVLFVAGAAWPFLAQAVLVALGAVLVSRVRLPAVERPVERATVRRDVAEGLRWTWGHPAVRTLTLTIVLFNVTYGAAWSVLVLYADQRLGLGAAGFGLLTTVVAVGGMVGTASYDWLERHVGLAHLMRVGLVIETLTHLVLALTRTPGVAMAVLAAFGAHAFVWGTTSRTVRMRAVPAGLQGRVGSLYAMGVFGGILVGQALGGVIARVWGVTGPFWFAFAGSALLVAVMWRALGHVAHADDAALAAT
ncbi:putative MFS family arabinose efflux permease [Geodermatophilus tzadiensis]|uniref:Putative MFS family arabinose efflux permease n=1 Tax=Geodermatophilus tzadiensis TaxID=1137988 RepID=A0A2T0T6A2_9ACTN|nr:MFS transporter [Geodermatophilus tzadiensis]PRY41190.1 putative MFS family arabinose efflux permease [Geodermatophilus tzadiensis]